MLINSRKNLTLLCAFFALCVEAKGGQTCEQSTVVKSPVNGHPMAVSFLDEFAELDKKIWSAGLGSAGPANPSELQWYLPEQARVNGQGQLLLTADRRDFKGKGITSAAINSAEGFSQLFGRFEIKTKLPEGAGTWPAFWLLPIDNSWPPEIDVVEELGKKPSTYYGSYHNLVDGKRFGLTFEGELVPSASDDFHVYAVDWRPDEITFSVDGKVTGASREHIPQKPMYMLLNLAFGGSWAGPVSDATPFPSVMEVEYVKVYRYCDLPEISRPRFLQLGKTQTTGSSLKPGGFVQVSGSIAAGDEPVPNVTVNAYLQSIDGKKTLAKSTIRVGNMGATDSKTYSFKLLIPQSIAPDYYNVKVESTTSQNFMDPVTAKLKNSVYRGSADVVRISDD